MATLLFGAAAQAYSDEAVKDAETLVQMTQDRYAVGEVTAADLLYTWNYHIQSHSFQVGTALFPIDTELTAVLRRMSTPSRTCSSRR